ncbi:ribonuclease domain-containing protein [Xenorhabdus littoralis]|uniref:ribonuclease domain-containing protein n=1 Tax=Xenorhabdus littoralis TaxID=2582835 RepID=UPI0029E7CFEC|nr:ribonuclease domain-containing protein [Xenorhabdus sp. psl]MDX7990322.1 barnase [Xenorhabdus sp. psl]
MKKRILTTALLLILAIVYIVFTKGSISFDTDTASQNTAVSGQSGQQIDVLTEQDQVADYLRQHHKLPTESDRHWFEADVNYRCGRRGSDRLLYSDDGLIYLTVDHYNNFTRLE